MCVDYTDLNKACLADPFALSRIDQIFDAISYDKGASVIRMLQSYLGAERFQV